VVQVHQAVGGGYGQGLAAIVANHLLSEAPLFNGVGGACGKHAREQEQDSEG